MHQLAIHEYFNKQHATLDGTALQKPQAVEPGGPGGHWSPPFSGQCLVAKDRDILIEQSLL